MVIIRLDEEEELCDTGEEEEKMEARNMQKGE